MFPLPLHRAMALALLLLCPACGDSGLETATPRLERLVLQPEGAWESAPRTASLVRTLQPPRELHPWTVSGARRAYVGTIGASDPSSSPIGLVLQGDDAEERTVQIPGPFDPQRFDRVKVHYRMHAGARMHVSGLRGGEVVTRSNVQVAPRADQAAQVEFYLPRNQTLHQTTFDELRIVFGEEGGSAQLLRIDLEQGGALAGLPLVGRDDPELLVLASEGRLGWAVPTGRVSQVTIPADAEDREGSTLVFSYGVPRSQAMAAKERLLLVVTAGRGKKRERFEFGLGKHGGTWQEAEIPLEDFSRKSLELRFEVLTDDDLNLSAFLSEPQWIRETEDPIPHVLLITSDTHRGDHLGAMTDHADLATPILDQLAQEGTLFERCYTTTNVTLPSHAALFTGVHPRDTGILDNRTALAEEAPTLAEAYREAGYATWAAVSTRFLSDRISGLGQGFERYSETTVGQRPAAETIATLKDWLNAEPERPTFCWLHLFDAHSPYEPPEEYRTASLRDVSTERSPAAHLARGQALYRGEIHYLDAELAPLLDLHESGWTAFTADHGEALGAHGIVFQHVELYPDTTHVPLILRGPGVPLGARISSFARHVDLGRTLLDLSGLAGVPFPGSNLLTSASASSGRPQFAIAGEATSASILDPDRGLLLVLHLVDHVVLGEEGPSYRRHQIELFDLERDPTASTDLMAGPDPLPLAAPLREQLLNWLEDARPLPWARTAELDEATRESLIELGYTGNVEAPSGRREIPPVPSDCDCAECALFRSE